MPEIVLYIQVCSFRINRIMNVDFEKDLLCID